MAIAATIPDERPLLGHFRACGTPPSEKKLYSLRFLVYCLDCEVGMG